MEYPVSEVSKGTALHHIADIERLKDNFPTGQGGQTACRIQISRIHQTAKSCMRNWPVPIPAEAFHPINEVLETIYQTIHAFVRESRGKDYDGFAIRLGELSADLDDAKVRALAAGARPDDVDEVIEVVRQKGRDLQAMTGKIEGAATDAVNKHTIEKQQNYYSVQAERFGKYAVISLCAFVSLCWGFWCMLSTFQSTGSVMKEYLAQDFTLIEQAYKEHALTKAEVGSALDRFKVACPECMRSLFLNTLIKSNAIRIIEVSFMLFLIAVSLKSLNSAVHNYTINMQRSNSLRAALNLLENSHSDAAKDAMMDKAAAAIFSHQPTGYNTKPPSNLVQNVMEWGKGSKDEA